MTAYGHRLRRFLEHTPPGDPYVLGRDHPAVIEGRTIFAKRRVEPGFEHLFKSGHNNRKIGARVMVGRWRGFPIYTLTLEERATCPPTCAHWRSCYGNVMNWSHRIAHGEELERHLAGELGDLNRRHRNGFVVRLHVLGDFYSVTYVNLWLRWLLMFPALRVYGYTAWPPGTPIGDALAMAREKHWDRFAVRLSNGVGPRTTKSVKTAAKAPADAVICPVQTERTECCATCGLCWSTDKQIAFLLH